ncbi:hypothetical protein IEQ34_022115 [Dendrobium chrysotoxum]|uniref:Uncharacterized protein n=1 Tax=Dendrobium chrysotoxum TaxID=161865 RepID=A0AAV7FWL8_DENCH|nr:hypothetical protein IEQ34_022115 [Dendrobium chrysotoxum]
MPRHLPFTNNSSLNFASFVARDHIGLISFVLFCALMTMACASHGRRWLWLKARRNGELVISAPQMQPMAGGDDKYNDSDDEDDASVWKKNIIMGEKCRLPDFSGAIIYDSKGNLFVPN